MQERLDFYRKKIDRISNDAKAANIFRKSVFLLELTTLGSGIMYDRASNKLTNEESDNINEYRSKAAESIVAG